MHVILGATGKVGGAAARELRRRGHEVRAVVRDPARGKALAEAGCQLAIARIEDRDALRRALEGADSVLAMCPVAVNATDVVGESRSLIETMGEVLAQVRPRRVVAISDYGAQHAEVTGITRVFHLLERRLDGLDGLTVLRSAEQMENVARLVPVARESGLWPSLHHPIDRPYPSVCARDVGLAAAALLLEPGPRVVHIEGPARHSASETAALAAAQLGRPVTALALPVERWEPSLTAAGLSADYARLVAELQRAHNAGRIEVEAGGERHLGTTTLAAVLARLAARSGPSNA